MVSALQVSQLITATLPFNDEQIKPGLLCPIIGNTYSGSAMLGLAATLDVAKAGDHIIMVSFGSGAGSDAFDITVTNAIESYPRQNIRKMIEKKEYVDYGLYMKYRGEI